MNLKLLETFGLRKERDTFTVVRSNIEDDSVFNGTNIWVLFFAILIASLGLNINSTAVVIGAMLISPLMGPILGVAVGLAINDLPLIRKASINYALAAFIGLTASTIYFLLSPIQDAHSEILLRTQPTVFDVLISLFGGFAGIIAISSKRKGNVIAGVAISTALMPPLCVAGYGLATWQLSYFYGAMYLYLINSVFISAATFITAYFFKFPVKKYDDPKSERSVKRIVWLIIILTLIPSIYLGHDLVTQNRFNKRANKFIEAEALFPNDYLLNKKIDAKNKQIILTLGGKEITETEITELQDKLKYYDLEDVSLEIEQGFAFLKETKTEEQIGLVLQKNEIARKALQQRMDSVENQYFISRQIYKEIKVQYPELNEAIIHPVAINNDTLQAYNTKLLVLLNINKNLSKKEKKKLGDWLKVRMNNNHIRLFILNSKDNF